MVPAPAPDPPEAVDPAVRAVGFTGSLAGGLALRRLAASRPGVIPVYAEMGTVNTVVVTPSAVGSPHDDDGTDPVPPPVYRLVRRATGRETVEA